MNEVEIEIKRWQRAIDNAKAADGPRQIALMRGLSELRSDILDTQSKSGFTRACALCVSVIAAGYLFWMSLRPDDEPDIVTALILLLCAAPPLVLFWNGLEARLLVGASRVRRASLEKRAG